MPSLNSWIRIFRRTGAVCFVEDACLGLALLLSCWLQPVAGLCGSLAVLGAWGVSRGLYEQRESRLPELLNAGLWGLFMGTVLPLDARSLLLSFAGGMLLSGGCLGASKLLTKRCGEGLLLTLPFALAVGISAWVLPESMPVAVSRTLNWGTALLESISVMTFTANPWLGGLFLLLLLRRSRWLGGCAVGGYLLGGLLQNLIRHQEILPPQHFAGLNYMLVAMALGGGLLAPDRFTSLRVFGGVGMTVILQLLAERVLGPLSWLTVTLPFNLVCLGIYFATDSRRALPIWLDFSQPPELRWRKRQYHLQRYPLEPPMIRMPVLGKWEVYQGGQGPWTHQYSWQHAVDWVLMDAEGCRHSGEGKQVEDFFAWNKTVVSPVDGVVETVVAGLPDQPIGKVETEHNWGNYVIIRDHRGFRVLLAHLKQHSLQVVPGQQLSCGQWVARCGNSGYSPEPHLHLHVQQGEAAGEATCPFRMGWISVNSELPAARMPRQGEQVEARECDDFLHAALSFYLDQRFCFEDLEGRDWHYQVAMAADGSFSLRGDAATLFFGRFEGRLMFYGVEGEDVFLQALYQHFPSIPLYARPGDRWEDILNRRGFPKVRIRRESQEMIRSHSEKVGEAGLELSDSFGISKLSTPDGCWTLKTEVPAKGEVKSTAAWKAGFH